MKKLLVFLMCAVAAASLVAQGQSESQSQSNALPQGPTFRTGIDLLTVDVSVVDREGQPVDGLLAPDFAVRIDGMPRRVVSAEQVKYDVTEARQAAVDPFETFYTTNLTPPSGRLIVIAVDQAGIRPGNARSVLMAAASFLDTLSPADRVAFYAYPAPGEWVDFTNDHLRLKSAMERVVGSRYRYPGKYNIGLYEAIAIVEQGDRRMFFLVTQRECNLRGGLAADVCEVEIQTETEAMVRTVRRESAESLRSLETLLSQLGEIEGPKTLILLSEGIVLDRPVELDGVIGAAAIARVSINVLLMDVPRGDITAGNRNPTRSEDRELEVRGLRDLAGGSRGVLYNVLGRGENIFRRLASETSAYYLLGVEQAPGDRDGGRHRIDVEVRRRGVTVRSRQAFVLSSATGAGGTTPVESLTEALKSPFGVAEIPLRITTFTRQHETDSTKVRVMLAAEVGQPGATPENFTVGYALFDSDGNVLASEAETRLLTPPNGAATAPLDYLHDIIIEPGVYSLRFGVVDSSGRRGGVVREVNAWQLAGEEFALGDLVIGEATGDVSGQSIRPGVEPRIRRGLGAVMDLHSTSPALLDAATVLLEIAEDPDAPALMTTAATVLPGSQPTSRRAQGVILPEPLPPGRYVVRARVLRDREVAGVLVRPFFLEAPAAMAALPPAPGLIIGDIARFDAASVLTRHTIDGMLDLVERNSPMLKEALVEARAGRYSAAAVEALIAGDQEAAAFLKGLDWFAQGQLDQAATQLQIAAGPRREFFPAAFYLGASFAAAGRDRDAAAVWQIAIGDQPRPSQAYTLFADARLRDGQPDSVIDVLKPAYERAPTDDEIGRRLAMAYLMTARYAEVLPVLHGYLSRHGTDPEALFAAVFAQYQLATHEGERLTAEDEARIARYVRSYSGPSKELLSKYLEVIHAR